MDEWRWPYTDSTQVAQRVRDVPFARDEDVYLLCTSCTQPIDFGTEACELFLGVVGHGEKSGRPMVVENPDTGRFTADLHLECIIDFAVDELGLALDDLREEDIFCAGCEAKLSGDSDDDDEDRPTRPGMG